MSRRKGLRGRGGTAGYLEEGALEGEGIEMGGRRNSRCPVGQ